MVETPPTDEFVVEPAGAEEAFILDLEGFEGPLDLLLALARDQKVDLTRLSILELADQYLAFIARARRLRLEIAADYLVMAAWLAYLKSRLLLPEPEGEEEPSGEELAEALAHQLRRLEAMREAGARIMARPQLGRDVFKRGAPEPVPVVKSTRFDVSLFELLSAYANQTARHQAAALRIEPLEYASVEDAIQRLTAGMAGSIDWELLLDFIPPELSGGTPRRSAVASTFAAGLELARQGNIELRQLETFGPIYLRNVKEPQ
jgi:segregation and condensation protein A